MQIAVVGLGKIGLPIAVQFASKGHRVTGVDINEQTVAQINAGIEPFPGEAQLAEKLGAALEAGNLQATTDYAVAIGQAEAVVVAVPLFVDLQGKPDFAIMDAATTSIGQNLQPGTLVSFETTLPVGTTRGRLRPILEAESGLVEGKDFHLVFSPERVFSGRVFADLRRYPKLVGGLDAAGTQRAVEFYRQVLDFDERPDLPQANGVWNLDNAETAELAKLAETTYRDVNIGLANQFATYAEGAGIDIYKVIEACNSQPFSHIHRPGIAVGGHCIPVYPRLYLSVDPAATIVSTARQYNAQMPAAAVARVESVFGPLAGHKVAALGIAYRGGVKESAFSGIFPLVEALRAAGAEVVVHDPLYSDEEIRGFGFTPYHIGEEVTVAFIQSDHRQYSELSPADLPGIKLLYDGRRISSPAAWAGTPRLVVGQAAAN